MIGLLRNHARKFSTVRPSKLARESWTFLSEIVGNPALAGKGKLISAGEILKLVDLAAASAAIMHIGHGRLNTLAFDRLDFTTPLFHGDHIHMDARVAHVGSTSVCVHCVGRKKDLLSRGWIHTHEALVVFVALGKDGRPEVAPSLVCETPEEIEFREMVTRRQELGKVFTKEQQEITIDSLTPQSTDIDRSPRRYREYLDLEDTVLRLRKIFMPRNLNALGTIFGGDLLDWMESAAVSCASQFLRNSSATTVAMDRVFLHRPVRPDQLADLTARVVRCSEDTVQVETEVRVLRPFLGCLADADAVTHRGTFDVLNATDNGYRRPIDTGLRLGSADARLRAARAAHRAAFESTHRTGEGWLARQARYSANPFLPEGVGIHYFGEGF